MASEKIPPSIDHPHLEVKEINKITKIPQILDGVLT